MALPAPRRRSSAEPVGPDEDRMLEAPARAALLAKRTASDDGEEPLADAFERGLVVEPRAREYGAEHIVCHGTQILGLIGGLRGAHA